MLNKIEFTNIRGDIFGGLTAAIVSLPLALTFGVASGAGPEAGLYGAIIIGFFTAIFGGSPTLISEPTGPMTVVMAAVISTTIAANPENGLAMAFTVVVFAGLFQIAFGIFKLGRYITLMPISVISGFMSGIGCVLIILQIAPLMGHSNPPGGVLPSLMAIPSFVSNLRPAETALGLATLALVIFTPEKFKRYMPPQLLALVVLSMAAALFLSNHDIAKIGEVDISLPTLSLPVFSAAQIQVMLIDGLVLGLLGSIDSMLSSVIADNLTRKEHDSDKELVGQGIGNMMSGLFGGLPGAGATMGTVVNIQSGGRTILSGVVRTVVLALAVFVFAGLLENIPLAVLAGIAIKVGIDIFDWSFMKRAHVISSQSAVVMYAVMLLTVLVDLIVAVGAGIFLANIMIIDKLSRSQERNVRSFSDVGEKLPLDDEEKSMLSAAEGKILYVYLSGTMIFGVAKALARQNEQIAHHKVVIVDLSDVSMVDDTMALAIENTILHAQELGKAALMVVKNEPTKTKLQRVGTLDILQRDNLFTDRIPALEKALAKC